MDFESALEFSGLALNTTGMSEDRKEGIAAYLEKRHCGVDWRSRIRPQR